MALPSIRAILFDVDETLYDRERAQRLVLERLPAALPELFGDIGLEAVWDAWEQSDRQTENHVYTVSDIRTSRNMRSAVFLRLLGLSEAHTDAVTDFYIETYTTVQAPIDGAAEVAREPFGEIQFRRTSRVVGREPRKFRPESRICFRMMPVLFEFKDQRHQCLGDKAPTEYAKHPLIVGTCAK